MRRAARLRRAWPPPSFPASSSTLTCCFPLSTTRTRCGKSIASRPPLPPTPSSVRVLSSPASPSTSADLSRRSQGPFRPPHPVLAPTSPSLHPPPTTTTTTSPPPSPPPLRRPPPPSSSLRHIPISERSVKSRQPRRPSKARSHRLFRPPSLHNRTLDGRGTSNEVSCAHWRRSP